MVTYPTGVKYWRVELRNESGSLRIQVEQFAGMKRGSREPVFSEAVGDVAVMGTMIPRGARGLLCHESLPVAEFKVKNWGGPKTAWAQGMERARKWFKALAPQSA